MRRPLCALVAAASLTAWPLTSFAADPASPWGSAPQLTPRYHGQKVVFDVTAGTEAELGHVLDRAVYLSQMNGDDPFETRIVVVLHGAAIPFFAIRNDDRYKALMRRAHSATLGNIIEFRMCQASARLQGLEPKDIHGFVTMVPMAEAEIARLQLTEGFAYMR
jgi:intracellular sulfur oxidation DsrE/DsrF family protein